MSKKLVVSLFAGAVLLSAGPAFAAGIVNGTCDNCHTMHNSQDGGTIQVATVLQLLKGNGCVGCHAQAGVQNDPGTGQSTGTGNIKAPQVDDSVNVLNGGYFNAGALATGDAERQHNVLDMGNDGDVVILATVGANGDQPGGAASDVPGGVGTAAAPALTCQGCHTQAGHHDVNATTYRMLSGANTSTRNVNYGDGAAGSGERADTGYDAVAMNQVCGDCHGTFHTAGAGGFGTAPSWDRHPVGISIATDASPSTAARVVLGYDNSNDLNEVVVGRGAAGSDIVMCISCHVPHGSDNFDLLAFDYATQVAGDGNDALGCETCHSYTTVGM